MLTGVLAASVGMGQQPCVGQTPLHRHVQRVHDQTTLHVLGHRPAHDTPRVQILDSSQVQPALPSRDVGDVDGLIANDKFCLMATAQLPSRRSNIS